MYEFTYYNVGDVMTTDPVMVGIHSKIIDLQEIFEKHDFNGIPVVDKNNLLIGMVTKLDILKAFSFKEDSKVPQYRVIMNQSISRIMTTCPHVVNIETPLTRVLHNLVSRRIKSVPVVKDAVVIGIIAREDILKALRLASKGKLPERISFSEARVAVGS